MQPIIHLFHVAITCGDDIIVTGLKMYIGVSDITRVATEMGTVVDCRKGMMG